MSKTDETYVPAFPFSFVDQSDTEFDGEQFADMGMSLRDYFAAKAMQGFCANPEFKGNIAELAYGIADVMLSERNK